MVMAISDKSLFSLRGEQSKMNYMDRRENQIALFNSLSALANSVWRDRCTGLSLYPLGGMNFTFLRLRFSPGSS